MKKQIKKILCGVLTAALCISSLTFSGSKIYAAGNFSKVGGWNETIYAEISGVTDEQITSVSYSGTMTGSLTGDALTYLVRDINGHVRIDIPGLKAGTYTLTVETTGGTYTQSGIEVTAYDRSGYAHFNNTEGVGAYNDDGTLKDNAIVLYVTDENKNTVTVSAKDGTTVSGIGNILNSVGQDNGTPGDGICELIRGGKNVTGIANTNQDIIRKLALEGTPLVVRIIGNVTAPEGLTAFNSFDYGGSKGDNGFMARMQSGKNITIEGIGYDATVDGWGFHFMCTTSNPELGKNFEVRNIIFKNVPEDCVGMEGVQAGTEITASVERCWVHNCEFNVPSIANPAESDKSEGDGACDFKRGQYFTNSYCWYKGYHKTNLIGSSNDSLQYNISMHHNYWQNVESRAPMTRNSNIHVYNNLYYNQSSYCMDARMPAYIFSEYNMFYMVKNPMEENSGGSIKSYKDSFAGYTGSLVCDIADNDRNMQISTGNKYANFDTNPEYSYIPTNNYFLQTDKTELRKTIYAYTGVMRENPILPQDVTMDMISFVPENVTPEQIAVPYTLSEAKKISKTVYAFTVPTAFDIEIAYAVDTIDKTGVLVKETGEAVLMASGTARSLPAGTYMIQSVNFQPSATAPIYKECTINSMKITSADPNYDPTVLKSIKLNVNSKTLLVGGTTNLSVTFEPVTAVVSENVVWESSDPTVATVSDSGEVEAVKEGTAIITASVGEIKDSCTITVSAPVALAGIKINETEPTVQATKTITLTASATNDTTDEFTVTWSSADTSVATVNASTGVVTGVAKGTAEITATATTKDGTTKTANVTVTVTEAPPVDTSGFNHVFATSGLTSTFYTFTGCSLNSDKTEMKVESSSNVSFTAPSDGTLTLVYGASSTKYNIKLDGTKQTSTAKTQVLNISAGAHTITKGDSTNLTSITYAPTGSSATTYTATLVKTGLVGADATLSKTSGIAASDSVTLTITPAAGYTFAAAPEVTATGATAGAVTSNSNGSYTCTITSFTADATVTVTGSAVAPKYTAELVKTGLSGADAALSKTSDIAASDSVTLTITPNSGYAFATAPEVTVTGATKGTVTANSDGSYTCTITSFTANATVTVTGSTVSTAEPTYEVTLVQTGLSGATATMDKPANVYASSEVVVTITPGNRKQFTTAPTVTATGATAGTPVKQADGSYKATVTTFTANATITVAGTATDEPSYAFSINKTGLSGATVSSDTNESSKVYNDETVTITITPDSGLSFKTAPVVAATNATVGTVTSLVTGAYKCEITNFTGTSVITVTGEAVNPADDPTSLDAKLDCTYTVAIADAAAGADLGNGFTAVSAITVVAAGDKAKAFVASDGKSYVYSKADLTSNCIAAGANGDMIKFVAPQDGTVKIAFKVSASNKTGTIFGETITSTTTSVYAYREISVTKGQTYTAGVSGSKLRIFYLGYTPSGNVPTTYTATLVKTGLVGADAVLSKTTGIASTDSVTLTIAPTSGYTFATAPTVTVDGATAGSVVVQSDGSYKCNLTGFTKNATVTVAGEAKAPVKTYTVSVVTDGNGTASASKTTVNANEAVTLKATPASGYKFKEWVIVSGTGAVLADKNAATTTLTVASADVTVKATFERKVLDSAKVKAFVTRFYTVVLNRQPDENGIADWTNGLLAGTQNGASASYGFVFSDEFEARNLSNAEKVDIMYATFLDRAADADGKKMWVDALDAGVGLEKIYEGFVMSTEFASICDDYGISAGTMSDAPGMVDRLNLYRNRNIFITEFVARCYTKALERARDIDGVEMWCRLIITGEWTPRNVAANGFFHSDEFVAKNTTNKEYVEILYRTFFDREADADGLNTWLSLLDGGMYTRDMVLDGFADSDEFKEVLASFGLN